MGGAGLSSPLIVDHRAQALRHRRADLPFIVAGVSDVVAASARWGGREESRGVNHEALQSLFGKRLMGVTHSDSASFLYFDLKSSTQTWVWRFSLPASLPGRQTEGRLDLRWACDVI